MRYKPLDQEVQGVTIKDITQEYLKSLLTYAPLSGRWFWHRSGRGRKKTLEAGGYDQDGYLLIRIDGVLYKAHRLAFLYMRGDIPSGIIDHLDRNTSNNRWSNLVESNHRKNAINTGLNKNNTSGYKGVWYDKGRDKWCAEIRKNYKKKFLGRYNTIEEAKQARKEAETSSYY